MFLSIYCEYFIIVFLYRNKLLLILILLILICQINNYHTITIPYHNIICVHPVNICDGTVHCHMFQDDESYCGVTECSDWCRCIGNTVLCVDLRKSLVSSHSVIKSIFVINSIISKTFWISKPKFVSYITISGCDLARYGLGRWLTKGMINLKSAELTDDALKWIDKDAFSNTTKLMKINLSGNRFGFLPSKVFTSLSLALLLQIHNSSLRHIHRDTFKGMISLTNLDMSLNRIESIHADHFRWLLALKLLNLTLNPLLYVDNVALHFTLAQIEVSLDAPHLCCYVQNTEHCLTSNRLNNTATICTSIIRHWYIRLYNIIFGSIFLVGSVIYGMKQSPLAVNMAHARLQQHLIFTDMLLEVHAIAMSVLSIIYEHNFIVLAKFLRRSLLFYFLDALLEISIMMSQYTVLLIVLNQLIATKYALIYRTMSINRIALLCVLGWLFIIGYTAVEYNTNSSTIDYLLFMDQSINENASLILKILFIACNSSLFAATLKLYAEIISHVKTAHEKLAATRKRLQNFKTFKKRTLIFILHQSCILALVVSLPVLPMIIRSADLESVVVCNIIHVLSLIHSIKYAAICMV